MKSALAASKGPGPIITQQTQQTAPRRINPGGEATASSVGFQPRVIPSTPFDNAAEALVGSNVSSFRGMSGFPGNPPGGNTGVHPHGPHLGQSQPPTHQPQTAVHQPQPAAPQPVAHPPQVVHHTPTQPHVGPVLPLQNATSAQPGAPVAPTTGGGPPPQQQYQRLKVEDALSYLDQVKLQFGSQPQVYNDFLDIMKEFKSQSIDTPGVINRVSNLFKGHPDLIVGFNTFLPPGYKIEVHASDPTKINFTTPNQSTPKTIPLPISGPPLGNTSGPAGGGSGTTPHPQGSPAAGTQSGTTINVQPSFQNQIPPINNKPIHPPVPQPHPPSHAAAGGHTYSQPPIGSAPPHPNRGPVTAQLNQQNSGQTSGGQPVEFNHAINYVNKIKNRFQGQPEIYKAFLEILHTYQKEQRAVKESGGTHTPSLSETQVFEQVAKLFKNQEDLLQEFGQFLPDANGSTAVSSVVADMGGAASLHNDHQGIVRKFEPSATSKNRTSTSSSRKSTLSHSHFSKKQKLSSGQGVSLNEARKHGSLSEFAFFDKVRKAFKSQDVYENFLRCLLLFNQEIVSRAELVQLVTPFLGKYPELLKWFKEFLGYKELDKVETPRPHKERSQGELYTEIDFSNCKRCGASYRALPKSYSQPKCSGRTALCNQVINDTWVSFPSWSEDSTFVTSRKTQYEEHIYRCEDERYELDIVIEVNTHTIRVLEHVNKKLSRMSAEEASKFKLDNCLGGTSEVLHRKAIQRIYGDKAPDIIEGLKKNPAVAVPLVLKRLKLKDDEWKEAQRSFNKIWREQNEKYYLKSLDHQGLNFKQNDVRALRSKSLLNDIETIFDERQENGNESGGPHLNFVYADKAIIQDVAALIIHHAKRQTGIHKEEKEKIKQILHHFLPDLFFAERGELSDDEDDEDDMETDEHEEESPRKENCEKKIKMKLASGPADKDLWNTQNDVYHVFFANNNWYLFFRLHNILCERLQKMKRRAEIIAESEGGQKRKPSKVSTAVALGLKTPLDIEPEDYYSTLLEMVRNVLDGNMESNIYEDQLREMFGIHAYLAFTLDKVVQNIVRQCQNIVVEDTCLQITESYLSECGSGGTGGTVTSMSARSATEAAYQRRVEQLLAEENCFKITYARSDSSLGVELLDTEEDHSDDPVEVGKWSSYMQKYVSQDTLEDLCSELSKKPVFLPRNLRRSRQRKETYLHISNSKEKPEAIMQLKPDPPSVLSSAPDGVSQKSVIKTESENKDCVQVKEEPMDTNQPGVEKEDREEDKGDQAGGKGAPIKVNHTGKKDIKKNGNEEGNVDLLDGVDMVNNMECKFNLNSYKMVYVVDSEDYMYRRSSLKKAKQAHTSVTENMAKKFDKWHMKWKGSHVTEEQEEEAQTWFNGYIDGLVPCKTIPREYVTANGTAMKYSVIYPENESSEKS